MSTFGTIQTNVQAMLGRSDDTTNIKILAACNTVQRLMASNGQWEDLEQLNEDKYTVDGTDEYVLRTWLGDTSFMKLATFQIHDGTRWRKPVELVTPRQWDERVAPVHYVSENKPELCLVYKRTLYLHPTPDAVYQTRVRWYSRPSTITSTSDTLAFDEMYDPLIEHAVAGFVWLYLEELDLAKQFMQMADGFLDEFRGFNNSMLNFASYTSAKHSRMTPTADAWANPFVNQIRS